MGKGYNPYRNPLNGQFTTASGAVGKALDLVSGPGSSRSARGRGPSSNASRRLAASADSRTSTGKTVRRGSVRSAQRDTSMPAASWSDDPGGTRRVGNRVERVTQARSQTDGLSRRDGSRVSQVRDLTGGGPRQKSKSDSRPADVQRLADQSWERSQSSAWDRSQSPDPLAKERAASRERSRDMGKAAGKAASDKLDAERKASSKPKAKPEPTFRESVSSMSDVELADYAKSYWGKKDSISVQNSNAVREEVQRRKSARSGSKPWTERSATDLAAENAAIAAERKARAERRAASRSADLPAAPPASEPRATDNAQTRVGRRQAEIAASKGMTVAEYKKQLTQLSRQQTAEIKKQVGYNPTKRRPAAGGRPLSEPKKKAAPKKAAPQGGNDFLPPGLSFGTGKEGAEWNPQRKSSGGESFK